MYDILIKNGTVIDGTGRMGQKADLAIKDGKISEIGPLIPATKAKKVIDAQNRFVVPGFIDVQNHSDSYWTLFDQPEQTSLLSQGITSIIIGNCGSSLAPLSNQESIKTIQKWHPLTGININWTSFGELLATIKYKKIAVNVGSLVGHATVRRGLLADQARAAEPDEIKVMDRMTEQALAEGALGLSLGLIYAHEVNSTFEELLEFSRNLKSQNKYLSVHLRSEGSHILEAVDEVLTLASQAEIAIKISHLKVRGKKNWHLFDQVLNKLEIAYHQGLKVAFDVYPYESSWTILYTYLPQWAYEGGRAQILRRIEDSVSRRKILDYLKSQEQDYGSLVVATAEEQSLVGKSVMQIAANQNTSPHEAVLNILTACKTHVIVFDHNLSAEQMEILAFSPLSLIATDGAGYSKPSNYLVHPRCFGTMPRFLKMVRDKKIISWEQAIKKLTFEPAQLIGIKNRGTLAVGQQADVVVFDPQTISDTADYSNPYQYAWGVEAVLVNGKLAYQDNKSVSLSGEVIAR